METISEDPSGQTVELGLELGFEHFARTIRRWHNQEAERLIF